MVGWLKPVLIAAAVMVGLWALLVALALRYAARRMPAPCLHHPKSRGHRLATSSLAVALAKAGQPLLT
jgi:hypothetical protein